MKRLGFGCVGLTSQPTQASALRLLDCAYDQGIRLFDTAPVYGKGYSEILLGKFIKNKRHELIITSKFGLGKTSINWLPPFYSLPLNYLNKQFNKPSVNNKKVVFNYKPVNYRLITKLDVENDLRCSLKRLKTNYIDNYLLHEAIPSFLSDEAIEFLMLEKQKGTIRNIGLGVNNRNLIQLHTHELLDWDMLQYEYGHNVNNDHLYKKFANKIHIYHSIFKSLHFLEEPKIKKVKMLGFVFAKILSSKPNAIILFSSSSEKNMIDNIRYTDFYFNKK